MKASSTHEGTILAYEHADALRPPCDALEVVCDESPKVVQLSQAISQQGSVMCWIFVPRPIMNGKSVEGDATTFVELPGLGKLNFWWYSGYTSLVFINEHGPDFALEMPGLPGPQWIHLCITWDADEGWTQGYLNGSPMSLMNGPRQAWQNPEVETIHWHSSSFPMAGLKVASAAVSDLEVKREIPSIYLGALDHLLGKRAVPEITYETHRGSCLYASSFSKEDLEPWVMEGPGEVRHVDGWMRMWSREPDATGPHGHLVYWCDRDFPSDVMVEFEVRLLSDLGLNIIFFAAKGQKGECIFDPSLKPRTGIFGHYTGSDIDCYHSSYFAGPDRNTTNLRKNSGFYLVDNGPIGIPSGDRGVHRVCLVKKGERIRLWVDTRLIIDWMDPGDRYGDVLGGGKIGFRQMRPTTCEYRNLKVSEVL